MKLKDHYLDGLAKAGDPVQSHEAGEDAVKTGLTSNHYKMIMAIIDETPWELMTNMDIAVRAGMTQNQVTRRMSELERRNLIKRGNNRHCIHLNRIVGTWTKC